MELDGAKVVITGASQGIGEELAEQFTAAGSEVLLIARSEDKLAALAERLGGRFLTADLSTPEGVDGLVDRCIEALGSIDVWVNNAGVETQGAFAAVDRDDVRRLTRLNYEAPVLLSRDVINHLLDNDRGHIVQVASVGGIVPFPGTAAYCGTKAGLINFTETLRIELKDTSIGLTVVCPGPVDTAMWERVTGPDSVDFAKAAMDRFRRLGSLPMVSTELVARKTLTAVAKSQRFVIVPARFQPYQWMANAPRRLVGWCLAGITFSNPTGRNEP